MSNSQKFENLLNLSISATQKELESSKILNIGFDSETGIWELIIKYSGDFTEIARISISYSKLINEYAVIIINENRLDELSALANVEYVEKPKALFFAAQDAKRASCLSEVNVPDYSISGLNGTGVALAVIDTGLDIYNNDFRFTNGDTRILYMWDQSIPGSPPDGYFLGTEFDSDDINEILHSNTRPLVLAGEDISGHGTAVCGIAAGNGYNSIGRFLPEQVDVYGRYSGVAPDSSLIIVKLSPGDPDQFPRTTQLMQAVDYVIKKARLLNLPVAVNISFGNNYGPHNGSLLLETYLDDISNYWKSCIVTGTGNEGDSRIHTNVLLRNRETISVSCAVGMQETSINVQIWKNYVDSFRLSLISPSGSSYEVPLLTSGTHRTRLESTELLIYVGEPSPFSVSQEIFIDFIPEITYINPGIWVFSMTGTDIVSGDINFWLPSRVILTRDTGFLNPTEELTLTVPSTSSRVISVGAYDHRTLTYAPFSGRGNEQLIKPDLVAPGVAITAPAPQNAYVSYTGTSIATPFVSGAAALLMQWGIVNGNDPYLYGEKIKAYLHSGARRIIRGIDYPNPRYGWGALCVSDSLPI